jgi:peptidoglycan/xylan/chitin deacetylase (PgdA/CDA1 family)
VTVPLGTPVARGGDGTVDLARVTGWQIGVVDAGAGAVSVWLNGLETVARPPRGVVSVVFDDARDGVARFARPVLDRYGMRASVAVVADLVGTPGFMTLPELRAAARFSGWDVVAHHATLFADDAGFVGLDDAALAAELDAVRAWLVAQGFAAGAAHLAYPSGAFDERTLEVVRTRFASGRTIVRGLGFETWPPADPFRIRALSVADRDGLDELRAAVDRAARERSWLVLVFHQLVDGSAQGPTDFAAEDFAALVAHLAGADVDVRPWSDVLHAR